MSQQGWVKLHRKMRECWLWSENEPFDKRSAWVDLLLSANHADNKTLMNNNLTLVKRGSFITSEVKLSERWKWDRGKVRRFLKLLESDNMLKKEATSRLYITITIINYDIYQGTTSESVENTKIQEDDTTSDEHEMNMKETSNEHVMNINKNDNNSKNDKENSIKDTDNVIPYDDILQAYNEICCSLPKIKSLSNGRKDKLKTRWKELKALDKFEEIFERVESSDFMKGNNNRKWKCSFDWLMNNDNNYLKVLEGKYDNKDNETEKPYWANIDS